MKRPIKIQHANKWKKNGKKNYYNDTIDVGWITTGKWFKTMWDFFTSYKIFKNRQK